MEAIRETYDKDADFTTLVNNIRDRIERLESVKRKAAQAEPTNPWQKAKEYLDWRRTEQNHPGLDSVIAWVDFLANRNEELEKQLATRSTDKAEADPWRLAKENVADWLKREHEWDRPMVAQYVRHLEADNAKQSARIAEQNEWLEEWDKVAWKILPGFDAPPNPSHVDKRVEELKSLVVEFQQNVESERSEKNGLLIETALKRDEIAGLRRIIAELESRPVPPLDPKRVYATWIQTQGQRSAWADAEPYPLAGDDQK
jgi:hypothetical protein